MSGARRTSLLRALRGASLAVLAAALLIGGRPGAAGADPSDPKPAKPSSLAPHPTSKRSFGAPIQSPILHKHHKPTHPTKPGEAPK
jgi:hypothetical protein